MNTHNLSVKVNALGTTKEVNGKVEECKGTMSVYGLGRFPVTLYPNQWLSLLDNADKLRGIIADHVKSGAMTLERTSAPVSATGRISLAAFTVAKK
jgi:hypothetical protein